MKRTLLKLKKKIMTNQYVKPAVIFLFLLSAIMLYYNNFKVPKVIRQTEDKVRLEVDVNAMPKVLVATVSDPLGIGKYTELTEELIEEKITFIEVPEPYAIIHGMPWKDDLLGKVTKQDLRYGEQISKFSLADREDWYGRYDRLKEYHIRTAVSDTVQKGNLVDVIIHYGNGDYDVVLSKVKVIDIVRGTSSGIQPDETNTWNLYKDNEYLVTLTVDEVDYMNMKLAENMAHIVSMMYQNQMGTKGTLALEGYFEVRLYIDEDQPESLITFDYDKRLGQLQKLIAEIEARNNAKLLEQAQNVIQENDVDYIYDAREREATTPYYEDLQESQEVSDPAYFNFIQQYDNEVGITSTGTEE